MDGTRRRITSRRRALLTAVALLTGSVGLAGVAAGTAGASAITAAAGKSASAPTVITWAEQPGETPDWIFPFASLQFFSSTNLNQFQYLMYRPLYWLSEDGKPAFNPSLSLASAPEFSDGDSVVTIPLKGWQWSNGTTIDAQDVMFFMNMLRSEPDQWAGTAPGELPSNVKSVTAPSATSESVSITFNHGYNSNFILYSELSQITPMPLAWDISKLNDGKPAAPGSGGCSSMTWNATTMAACTKVWAFMTDDGDTAQVKKEAGDLNTYASNPLWQVVDGPWQLESFNSDGAFTMVPNTLYSGPVKPSVDEFEAVPYVTDASEFAALRSRDLTVGYLPLANAPAAPSPGGVGPNAPVLASSYDLGAQFPWQMNYFPINFNSTGDGGVAGTLFHQLYIRQALQELVDQPTILSSIYKNYATADDGPVPTLPDSAFLSSAEQHNPYPYDLSAAEKLLKSHGWTVNPGGTDVCSVAAKCGSGVPKGAQLSLSLPYVDGDPAIAQQVSDMVGTWSAAGIAVAKKPESFIQVISTATPCTASPSCTWEMADWGGGWIYAPDYDPTGEYLFQTGAEFNSGSYSDATNDSLINKTVTSSTAGVFHKWENYITGQVPVIWQPVPATIVEFSNSLTGVEPFDPYGSLTPEAWRFSS